VIRAKTLVFLEVSPPEFEISVGVLEILRREQHVHGLQQEFLPLLLDSIRSGLRRYVHNKKHFIHSWLSF